MYFSGDASTRKRVDLGGRSTKERDRQKLLEQTRLERNRRLWVRQQNSAALHIQKFYRARMAVRAEHCRIQEHFFATYGKHCQFVDRNCFSPESEFLRRLLFFFNACNVDDFVVLVEACRLFQKYAQDTGDIVGLFSGMDYSSRRTLVDYRVKKFAYKCILAVHHNRHQLKDQFLMPYEKSGLSAVILLEAVVMLLDPQLPWVCQIVQHLVKRNAFMLLREIIFTAKESMKTCETVGKISSLELLLSHLISHVGQQPCICPNVDPRYSFSSQILTVPLLWRVFQHLKEVFASRGHTQHYIRQMASCLSNHAIGLPSDVSPESPGFGCLLGNILEAASVALSRHDCPFNLAKDFAAVMTYLLEALPSMTSSGESKENSTKVEDEMNIDDESQEKVLNTDLEQQILDAINPRFLSQLINVLFRGSSLVRGSHEGPDDREVAAVGAVCAFLHVTFNTLPLERMMTILAFRTELVPVLWNFMKRCHENKKWPSFSEQLSYLCGDIPGWLLPLAVFCPVYKHILMIVDNEEFYEKDKPLSLKDIRTVVIILQQALWHLLWLNPLNPPPSAHKRNPLEFLYYRVSIVSSELLSQLQDWNNRREFTLPSDFHADGVNEYFISQALMANTRANYILKQAPFLIPFTSRVKIFTSQLTAARQADGSHAVFIRNRFKIRRDHILEDAFNQLNDLSEEDLRGLIRVSFINEFGAEEAGVDGGGIFKDFMENITRAAFDVQYGLFKETSDHMLYPNPGSGMIHEQHLKFFHFLGTVLGKAMFEGILVDIPFATFFLSKLKQKSFVHILRGSNLFVLAKSLMGSIQSLMGPNQITGLTGYYYVRYNYLNDLPSLDPELYRHLLFLKHYEGDLSELELYFVIVNNEYGEQMEEELLPGGRNIRVTNENVITFIHLMANHRLNVQTRQQCSHFMRGFQQLIQKDWIEMFNGHELQLLISGSLDGLDVDNLRSHTNYAAGYHSEHCVIEMFWEVLKSFSLENQMKFLKFVTGCSRGPLLGFKYLEPLFCIQRAGGNASDEALDRLPTSATCMNLLKLPPYRSKQQLERKLLYAINADAGFDLS